MKGFPKKLNSRTDYLYIKDNFDESLWKPAWLNMWEQRKHWMPVFTADTKEGMIEDETHRIVEQTDDMGGGAPEEETTPAEGGEETTEETPAPKVTYQQEEYVDDPRSDFFLFGFSEKEVKAALGIK